ncbi:hypothetical protein [Streptomyces sclerotialus]
MWSSTEMILGKVSGASEAFEVSEASEVSACIAMRLTAAVP